MRAGHLVGGRRTAVVAALLWVVLLPFAAGVGAQAAGATAPVVDDQGVQISFPERVDFTLKAHGFEASRAELNYKVAGEMVTSGLQATVDQPTSDLDLTATLDLSYSYIPPGAEVSYYWKLSSDSGEDVYTPQKSFVMEDDRYTWKSLSDTAQRVSVHWYEGDQQFGEALRTTARDALQRLEHNIGAGLERPASIWVYANQNDLLNALPKNIPEWVGGQAFPELSVVVADISNDETAGDEAKRVIPHELSHLLLYQATRNPYNVPPAWLDEGLAVHNQEVQDPDEEAALRDAARAGKLIPLKSLSGSFGADESEAVLDYAESRSAVDFMLSDSRYGPEKFARTIAAFRKGATYDDAMKEGLGVTVEELDAQWREALPYKPGPDLTTVGLVAGVGACAALALLGGVVTVVVLVRRSRAA